MKNMSDKLIREIPKRPVSEVFAYRHVVDPYEFKLFKSDPGYLERLKQRMARALAEMIVEKCQLFEMPSEMEINRGIPIQMQCVVNDRGSYENWLPEERKQGQKEGAARVIKSLPYGYEPNQFWE